MAPIVDPARRYTARQTADLLGLHPRTVRARIAAGALPAEKTATSEWRVAGAAILLAAAAGVAAGRDRRGAGEKPAVDPDAWYDPSGTPRSCWAAAWGRSMGGSGGARCRRPRRRPAGASAGPTSWPRRWFKTSLVTNATGRPRWAAGGRAASRESTGGASTGTGDPVPLRRPRASGRRRRGSATKRGAPAALARYIAPSARRSSSPGRLPARALPRAIPTLARTATAAPPTAIGRPSRSRSVRPPRPPRPGPSLAAARRTRPRPGAPPHRPPAGPPAAGPPPPPVRRPRRRGRGGR